MRTAQKHWDSMAVRRNGRHNRDLNKARAAIGDNLADRLLERWGDGIQICVNMAAFEERRGLLGRLCPAVRRDGRKQKVTRHGQLSGGAAQPHLGLLGAPLNYFAKFRRARINVEGRDVTGTRVTKPLGDVKSRFAETDKTYLQSIVHRRDVSQISNLKRQV